MAKTLVPHRQQAMMNSFEIKFLFSVEQGKFDVIFNVTCASVLLLSKKNIFLFIKAVPP
jgi:hypothetical protein